MKHQFLNLHKPNSKHECIDMKKTVASKPKSAELGEHRIIEIIQNHLTPMPNIAVSFGDDISAVNLNQKMVAVLKTDMLNAKTDVPKAMSLTQAARKAIVMNVSDFAAKGVQPQAALVALGLPRGLSEKDVEAIAKGLNSGAQEYGAYVVGGDTSEASDLIISVMLYGVAEKPSLMLRSGSKPGDILAVTGAFGNPAAGLRSLLEGFKAPGEVVGERLLESVFLPKARLSEGLALAKSGAVSASMDSSDGLAWSLNELGRQSNVGFTLDKVPVAAEAASFAKSNGLDVFDLALYGGEEYELVLTVKSQMWSTAEAAVKAVGGQLLWIGKATKNPEIQLDINGEKCLVEARGWEHFKSHV
jgi:thiamine-monophosphate kinase